ncbi:MAG: hypothetical protein IRZ03_18135 [Acidobacterium ailaaui]|nr:hypothetical protein [Pseudacidobacterium ailaaui]
MMNRDVWLVITNDFDDFGYHVEKFLTEEEAKKRYEIAEQNKNLVVLAKVLEGRCK